MAPVVSPLPCAQPHRAPGRQNAHPPLGLLAQAAGGQVVALGQQVLEAADVAVLGTQVGRLLAPHHLADGLLRFLESGDHRVLTSLAAHREETLLHLGDGVAPDDVDGDAAVLGVAKDLGLAAIVAAHRD